MASHGVHSILDHGRLLHARFNRCGVELDLEGDIVLPPAETVDLGRVFEPRFRRHNSPVGSAAEPIRVALWMCFRGRGSDRRSKRTGPRGRGSRRRRVSISQAIVVSIDGRVFGNGTEPIDFEMSGRRVVVDLHNDGKDEC